MISRLQLPGSFLFLILFFFSSSLELSIICFSMDLDETHVITQLCSILALQLHLYCPICSLSHHGYDKFLR